MVCYQYCVFTIAFVTGECTILILRKYDFKVFAILFGFWSSCLKFYIHLLCINTQLRTTTLFSLWSPLEQVSLPYWNYKNMVLSFVWYRLVFIQLILKFIFIYPASTHSDKQYHHLTSLPSYHLVNVRRQDCIRG